jgi:ATP-dependent DNA ligase
VLRRHADQPMRLLRVPEPFDHPHFVFEPKIDGFRALAHVEGHRCTLVSRNGHVFKSWPQLAEEIAHAVRALRVVLDGEICCLSPDGCSDFNALLSRREWLHFYAFDILSLEGRASGEAEMNCGPLRGAEACPITLRLRSPA